MGLVVDIKKKLGDFTLEVQFETRGNVMGLLGASGCGKSMTLKCIAGVEKPDEGRIVLEDKVLFDSEKGINLPPQKRKVGYLFQDYALFPNMTVLQNVKCGAGTIEKAKKYIKKYALEGTENLYPDQLSGGQKQRVALARMLSSEPRVLLLDEPFTALDNFLKSRMERQLMEIIEDKDKDINAHAEVIFVSHDRNEVYRLTHTIAVMEEGKVVDISEKHDLFRTPRTLASTLLTGCKNISRLDEDDKGYKAIDWGIGLKGEKYNKEKYLYAGIRAHDLRIAKTKDNLEYAKRDLDNNENVISCELVREVEDTFSVVIQLMPQNLENKTEYSLITYETSPAEWERIKNNIDTQSITVIIPEDSIIWMKE